MCMQDIRIGRRTYVQPHSGNLLDATVLTFPANPNRLGIVIGPESNALLVMRGTDPGSPFWARIDSATTPPRERLLRVEEFGQLVTDSISVQATGGNLDYFILELIATPAVAEEIQEG